jgi:hypothetical protein
MLIHRCAVDCVDGGTRLQVGAIYGIDRVVDLEPDQIEQNRPFTRGERIDEILRFSEDNVIGSGLALDRSINLCRDTTTGLSFKKGKAYSGSIT